MQDKKAERDFFDKFGNINDYDVFDERGYQRIMNEFFKYLNPDKPLTILDFGCGTGAFTAKFQDLNFELYGIDISPKCIDYAKSKYPKIRFSVADVENTSFNDNTFDVIFMSGLLHHFPDFNKVLKESHRILKTEGIIICYDPHYNNPVMWLYRCKESPLYSSKGVTANEHPLKKREIINALSNAGFSNYYVYAISGVTYKYIESRFASFFLPIYNVFERFVNLKPLRNQFGSFVITYAKK